jgi:hypothetical protein
MPSIVKMVSVQLPGWNYNTNIRERTRGDEESEVRIMFARVRMKMNKETV